MERPYGATMEHAQVWSEGTAMDRLWSMCTLKNYTPLYMGCIHKDPLYKLKPCTCRDGRTMYRKHSM